MSAAAGISAAKKRRGVVSTGPEVSQNTNTNTNTNTKQGPTQMVTPIQILQNHELRLKQIESQINTYDSEMELQQQQQELSKKEVVATPTPTPAPTTDYKLLLEYKNRCDSLEKKVVDLTELVQKVQTFSMESNLAFLKLKRVFDEDFESRIQELKQCYVSDDNMIQAVKFDTAAALSSMSAETSFSTTATATTNESSL